MKTVWTPLALFSLLTAPTPATSSPATPAPAAATPVPSAPPSPMVMATPYLDEGDAASLLQSLSRTEAYLAALRKPSVRLMDRDVPVSRLRRSVARMKTLVQTCWGTARFRSAIKLEFEAVAMPGADGTGTVHFTGYYMPMLEARRKPDARYRFPVYAVPHDLGRVKPYHTRAEIEDGHALAGRGLELGWVDDELALFGLMVQGSGMLRYEDGTIMNANYAAQNGHPYVSLGKTLIADGKIPQEKISMPAIRAYFKEHPDELHGYLLRNPSYVFFRLAADGPFGSSGIQLVPGRAIATDKTLFPPGTIAYLEYPRAQFDETGAVCAWAPGGRFVVDQDTGGAIRGPGRIDIYWGGGEEAARRAGTLNGHGRATFLLLKD